ncbi:MAG: hypothetical protein WC551_09925 [Patescibacteria group bacterium]
MTWIVKHYVAADGTAPARQWINSLTDRTLQMTLRSKIEKLSEHGLLLLQTNSMERIDGDDADLYELKAGQGRIVLYFDRRRDTFVLLNAFLKKRRKQRDKIEEARRFLHDFYKRGEVD